MARLTPVTEAELAEALSQLEDLSHKLRSYADRIGKGYVEEVANPMEKIATLNFAASSAVDLQNGLIYRIRLADEKRELEAQLRAEIAGA